MRLFSRSSRKRIVKKWYRRTGYLPMGRYVKVVGVVNGLNWYKVTLP